MKPYQAAVINIFITDSHGNIVSEDHEMKEIYTGVYSGHLDISDAPPLGQWTISVSVDLKEKTVQKFEVSEHVLPRFSVNVESPGHVLLSDGKVKVFFKGDYSFGGSVEGSATITAKIAASEEKLQNCSIVATKLAKVFSKKYVEFNFVRDLKLKTAGVIQIEVTIEEISTGKKAKISKSIFVHETAKHSIELITNDGRLKPGFPYTFKAVVRKFDGSLETDTAKKVRFDVVYTKSRSKFAENISRLRMQGDPGSMTSSESQSVVLSNGVAFCTFEVPSSAWKMQITVKYLGEKTNATIFRPPSLTREILKAEVVEER